MTSLTDTTVLVTGASAGIGEACARAFADAGARLLLCARRMDRLEFIARELKSRGTDVHTFALDVRRSQEVEHTFASLPDAWKDVDILVNNAGLSKALAPVYENRVDDIDVMVDTNIKGLLYITRMVVPGMVARGRGHIFNLGSTAAHGVYPGGTVYCATKHAVRAVTQGLKMDLHGTPIRVTEIDPGLVDTEFSTVRFEGDKARADATYAGMTPLVADDVADVILFCATRPAHVNVASLMLTPVDQSGTIMIHRKS